MEVFLFDVVLVFIGIILFTMYKLYKNHTEKDLFKKAAWCITKVSRTYRSNLELLDWIHNVPFYSRKKKQADRFFPNADKLLPIEEKYSIVGDEEENIAKEILEQYQNDLIEKYFSKKLYMTRSTRKLTAAEYFLFTLVSFLHEHKREETFNGQQMYEKNIYYKSYLNPTYRITGYKLTDYAAVYYKMMYIAEMYCSGLQLIPPDYIETTKQAIDTRKVKESSF